MTQGMDAYPAGPPVAQASGPPIGESMLYGAGTAPGAEGDAAQPERRGRGRLIGGVVAATLVIGALAANAMTGGDGDQKHVDPKEYAADLQAQSGDQVDVCPTGMYDSKKPFALAKNVKPGYLQEAPKGNILEDPKALISWQYGSEATGEKGALCALPTEVATFEHVFNQWVGTNSDGSKVRPFDSTLGDINELTGFYAIHDDKAEATISSEPFKAFMANFKPNEEALKGTWSRLLLKDQKVAQQHVDVDGIKPGEALILKGDVWVGDGKYSSRSQIVAILGDGTILVKRSLGVETIAPEQNSTTTSAAENNGGGDASTEGDQDSNTGGASNQTDQSGANGDVGSCSHGVPGGCDGDSPGGGGHGGGGTTQPGGGTTGTTRPGGGGTTQPPQQTTQPPQQTTQPPQQTTQPPQQTTQPPRTTTTRPPQTTTQPQPTTTKGPVPCDPDMGPCDGNEAAAGFVLPNSGEKGSNGGIPVEALGILGTAGLGAVFAARQRELQRIQADAVNALNKEIR